MHSPCNWLTNTCCGQSVKHNPRDSDNIQKKYAGNFFGLFSAKTGNIIVNYWDILYLTFLTRTSENLEKNC